MNGIDQNMSFSLKMTENTIFKQGLNQDQGLINEIRHSLWVGDQG